MIFIWVQPSAKQPHHWSGGNHEGFFRWKDEVFQTPRCWADTQWFTECLRISSDLSTGWVRYYTSGPCDGSEIFDFDHSSLQFSMSFFKDLLRKCETKSRQFVMAKKSTLDIQIPPDKVTEVFLLGSKYLLSRWKKCPLMAWLNPECQRKDAKWMTFLQDKQIC